MASTPNGGASGSGSGSAPITSHAPAAAPRPKVQQLRPTNKVPAAPDAVAGPSVPRAGPRIVNAGAAQQSPQQQQPGATSSVPRTGPRVVTGQGGGNNVLVNACQKGNPLLQHVRLGWEFAEIIPDYQVGVAAGALFLSWLTAQSLSLRYHRLHPEYIHSRIEKMRGKFSLRILLVMCDVDTHEAAMRELTKVALVNHFTLIVAWSAEEAGRYIETYKAQETRAPDLIRGRVDDEYMAHLQHTLTSVRGVNKTDVVTLATNFGSLKRMSDATYEELGMCPGFGDVKAKRLREAFTQPFRVGETRLGRERGMQMGERGMGIDEVAELEESAAAAIRAQEDMAGVATEGRVEGQGARQRDKTPPPAAPPRPPQEGELTAAQLEAHDDDDEAEAMDSFMQMSEEEQLALALAMSVAPEEELAEEDAAAAER